MPESRADKALDESHELHQRLALAEATVLDALDQLLDARALPGMTRRSLRRVLTEAQRHLADAKRMTTTRVVTATMQVPETEQLTWLTPDGLTTR